jgi:hypothetical protein
MPAQRRCWTTWGCASKWSPRALPPERRIGTLECCDAHFDACCIHHRCRNWLRRHCSAPELARSLGVAPKGQVVAYVPYRAMVDTKLGLHPSLLALSGLPRSSMVEHRPLLA